MVTAGLDNDVWVKFFEQASLEILAEVLK